MNATSLRRSSDACCSTHAAAAPAGGQLQPGQRVDRHDVGRDPADVAQNDVGMRPLSRAQTRSHRPGRSARVIGPPIANATGFGSGSPIPG